MIKRAFLKTLFLSFTFLHVTVFSAFADGRVFIPGTNINGLHVGGMTVEQAKEYISSQNSTADSFIIKLIDGDYKIISGSDYGLIKTVNEDELNKIIDAQISNGGAFGMNADWKNEVGENVSFDEQKLNALIDGLDILTNQDKTSDAHISEYTEGQPFYIIPEHQGNSLDTERTKNEIKAAIMRGDRYLDLNQAGVYDRINVYSTDPELIRKTEILNKAAGVDITLTAGAKEIKIGVNEIKDMVTGSDEQGRILLDDAMLNEYVKGLAASLNTVRTERVFNGGSGRQVSIISDYGWEVDIEKEAAALKADIENGQPVRREPNWKKRAVSFETMDWGNTYIEIDLTAQHVYYIQDGNIVWDAPCVTGNVARGDATPPGIFSVYAKQTNRVLRGKMLPNGKREYETPVSYWMPFNGGIGLHDASWRGSFGGEIYRNSGSHGCINLPPKLAGKLYDLISVGTIVVCHN